jgi:hypothetical protein
MSVAWHCPSEPAMSLVSARIVRSRPARGGGAAPGRRRDAAAVLSDPSIVQSSPGWGDAPVRGSGSNQHTAVHQHKETTMRGTGRAVFTASLLLLVGTLNIFYGIGALGDASVYVGEKRLVFDNLHTYGWVLIILAVIQLTGGFSLLAGNAYGRVIGIFAAGIGALANLTSIGGNNPWWRLGGFALCVYILYGLIVFGQDVKEAKRAGQM